MTRKSRFMLLGLLALALAFRLIVVGFVVGWHTPPKGDELDYIDLATSLANGDGYQVSGNEPTARRPFLYPAMLAVVFKVTGASPAASRALQVVIGVGIVGLVWLVARRYFGVPVAWVASGLTAFNPFLIFISGYILTENTYIALLLGLLLAAPNPGDLTKSRTRLLLAAVILALGCLARPTTLGVMLWTLGGLWLFAASSLSRKGVATATIMVTTIVVLLPWAGRNHAMFGKWVFFTTHGGVTFYQGNNQRVLDVPQYRGGVAPLAQLPGYDTLKTLPTVAKDEAAYEMGFEFLRNNKRHIPILVARKFTRFWRLRSDVGLSGIRSGWWFNKDSAVGRLAATLDVGFAYAVIVMPLFIVGMGLLWRRVKALVFLYGMIVVHAAYPLIFHGSIRMRIPIEPIIAIFAAYAVVDLWGRMARRRQLSR